MGNKEFAETYPPLSLRDISPTRGEIGLTYRVICGAPISQIRIDLPPCGGDVGPADREGYPSSTSY